MSENDYNDLSQSDMIQKISLVTAPQGVFSNYYTTTLEPDEILYEIETIEEAGLKDSNIHRKLYDYRFTQKKEAKGSILVDRFLAFWVTLQYYQKSTGKSKFRNKIAKKELEKYLNESDLLAIIEGDMSERILYEQLYTSLRRYLVICKSDKTYKSVVFGISTLKEQQLKEKILADTIDGLCFCWQCGLLIDYPIIGKATIHALLNEYPKTESIISSRLVSTLKLNNAIDLISSLC